MELLQRLKAWKWAEIIFYSLIVVAISVGLIWAKKVFYPPAPAIDTTPQVAPEAPQAAKVERIYIPGPTRIMVYDRTKLLDEIPVPPAVSNNLHNQFTATATVPPSPHGGTAVAFTNTSTGITNISYQAKPRPFIEWGGGGAVFARGGVGAGNKSTGYVGTLGVRQKLITVAGKPLSFVGDFNVATYQDPEFKATLETDVFSWD